MSGRADARRRPSYCRGKSIFDAEVSAVSVQVDNSRSVAPVGRKLVQIKSENREHESWYVWEHMAEKLILPPVQDFVQ